MECYANEEVCHSIPKCRSLQTLSPFNPTPCPPSLTSQTTQSELEALLEKLPQFNLFQHQLTEDEDRGLSKEEEARVWMSS